MKLNIPSAVTRRVSRQILLGRKHSPTILFGVGVAGMIATTVTACKATLKVEQIIDETQEKLELARTYQNEKYSDRDRQQDKIAIYIQAAAKFTKLYGPSVVLGALSIAALTGSHNILSKRNASLTAAYAAVDKAFKQYRERVVTELGDDKDREFRYGTETVTVTSDDTNGPKKKQVKVHGGQGSMYSRFFDESNPNWCPQPEYNIAFLRSVMMHCNDRLKAKGHLFLNDVYDDLGMDRTPAGQSVGWLWKPKETGRDNYVDFGIWADENMTRFLDFATGRESGVWLDFNVDGPIWDQI